VLAEVSALDVALVRAIVAFVVLSALLVLGGRGTTLREELRERPLNSLVQGIISFAASSLLAMIALSYLPASVVGLLSNTSPLWLAIGTLALFRPADSWRLLLGAAIAFAGMALVLFQDSRALAAVGAQELNATGIVIALLCSVVIALSAVWGRYSLRRSDPLASTALAALWGALPLAFLAGRSGEVSLILTASLPVKGLLLFLGVGCTAVNFALWFHALQKMPAARASIFQYLVPLITAVLAAVFLAEPITLNLALGGMLIFGGIALAQEHASSSTRALSTSP